MDNYTIELTIQINKAEYMSSNLEREIYGRRKKICIID